MPASFIALNGNTPRVNNLLSWIRQVSQVYGAGQQIAGELVAMVNGTDYTMIETMFGLSAGQGQTLYNLVVGANAQIQDAAVAQLINEVG
jgi:hypothetical protein